MSIWFSADDIGNAIPLWRAVSRHGEVIVQDEASDGVAYRSDGEATLDIDVAFTDYHDGVRLTFDSSEGGERDDDYDIFQVILPSDVAHRLGQVLTQSGTSGETP